MDADKGGDKSTYACAGDDLREERVGVKGFNNADVVEAEDGAALEDEGGTAKGLPGVRDEGEALLRGKGGEGDDVGYRGRNG